MTFTRIIITKNRWEESHAFIVCTVADGMADAEILHSFLDLQPENVREALGYAVEALRERELPIVSLS